MASDRPDKPRWFDNQVTVVVLLIFFFPLGLYALWKNSTFESSTKWIVTGMIVMLVLVAGTRREPREQWASADLPVSTGAEVAAPKSAEQKRRKSESNQARASLADAESAIEGALSARWALKGIDTQDGVMSIMTDLRRVESHHYYAMVRALLC